MREGRLREQRALGDCLNHLLGPERDWSDTFNQRVRFVNNLGEYYKKIMGSQDVAIFTCTWFPKNKCK